MEDFESFDIDFPDDNVDAPDSSPGSGIRVLTAKVLRERTAAMLKGADNTNGREEDWFHASTDPFDRFDTIIDAEFEVSEVA